MLKKWLWEGGGGREEGQQLKVVSKTKEESWIITGWLIQPVKRENNSKTSPKKKHKAKPASKKRTQLKDVTKKKIQSDNSPIKAVQTTPELKDVTKKNSEDFFSAKKASFKSFIHIGLKKREFLHWLREANHKTNRTTKLASDFRESVCKYIKRESSMSDITKNSEYLSRLTRIVYFQSAVAQKCNQRKQKNIPSLTMKKEMNQKKVPLKSFTSRTHARVTWT